MHVSRIVIVLLSLALFWSCKENGTEPPPGAGTTERIDKSRKRGLAYDLRDAADLDTLKGGVSWWYNWYFTTSAPAGYNETYQMEFVPMLWGRNSSQDAAQVLNFILAHPEVEYLLVLNEPNLTDQANLSPSQAASEWSMYEQIAYELSLQGRTVSLVGPAMNWGTMTGYADPVVWLDDFYAAYRSANGGQDPRIDYLAFHWYDYGLEAQLDRLRKYGKDIWITEMANWNPNITTYQQQAEQMQLMVALCENRHDVFRYAWFIGRGSLPDSKHTYLFGPGAGELNDLGRFYLTLPFAR